MVSKTIEHKKGDGKHKLIVRLEVLDLKYEVVKLYRDGEETYEEALEETKSTLRTMVKDGLDKTANRKIKYLIDGQAKEKTKKVRS